MVKGITIFWPIRRGESKVVSSFFVVLVVVSNDHLFVQRLNLTFSAFFGCPPVAASQERYIITMTRSASFFSTVNNRTHVSEMIFTKCFCAVESTLMPIIRSSKEICLLTANCL